MTWVWVTVIFRWLCFIPTPRSHPNRWAAVVPQSNYLIRAVVRSRDFSDQHLIRRATDPSFGSSVFMSTTLLPIVSVEKSFSAITQECFELYWRQHPTKQHQYGHPLWKLSKLDEPDMRDITGEKTRRIYSISFSGIDSSLCIFHSVLLFNPFQSFSHQRQKIFQNSKVIIILIIFPLIEKKTKQ